MPRDKDHEKNRLRTARLKKLSRFPKSTKLKRPSDPEQAKEWLRDVADHLSNLSNAGPPFRFAAYAIKRFLRSNTRNLSKELDLVSPRGRQRTFKERITEKDRARKTHRLIREGKTWPEIEKTLKV
jgi:gluconate kinase